MNQDYVFASQDTVGNLPNLFAVADGMGGHNAGDYASSHAVRILVDEIREDTDYNPVKVIRHAIETANTEIIEQAQKDEKLRGMGTTMVVATIVGQYAYVANVGDSRLYVAGGCALLHVIIQAGAVFAAVSWQRAVAGTDHVNLPHQLNDIFDCGGTCVGTEIFRLVLFHSSGKKNSGVGFIYSYFDKGVGFVIL